MKIRVILSNELEVFDSTGNSLRIPPNTAIEVFLNEENLSKLFTWTLYGVTPDLILQLTTKYDGQEYVIDVRFTASTEPNLSRIVRDQHDIPCMPSEKDLFVIGRPPRVDTYHHVQKLLYIDGFKGGMSDLVGSRS